MTTEDTLVKIWLVVKLKIMREKKMDERKGGSSPNRKQPTLKDTKHRVPNTRHYIQALF